MILGTKSPGYSLFAACVVLLAGFLLAPSASAQLIIEVGDTTAAPGAQNTVISVSIVNLSDTVAGFNLWIQLDRPDIMLFQTNSQTKIDTTYWICNDYAGSNCIDSTKSTPLDYDFITIDTNEVQIGSWDTTGTLISGWESVDARSLSGFGYDLNIVGIANLPSGGYKAGIAPQNGGVLIKLLADVLMIPDTATGLDRTVNMLVQHQFTDHFSFSRPDGTTIGLKDTIVQDTNYWICTAWAGDVCLNWQRVSQPPADSFQIVERTDKVIDYNYVFVADGMLTVLEGMCGDMNGDFKPQPNIADLTYLVNFLFKAGPAPVPLWKANVNCIGIDEPNVADLTYMVAFLFKGGPAPCQGPAC